MFFFLKRVFHKTSKKIFFSNSRRTSWFKVLHLKLCSIHNSTSEPNRFLRVSLWPSEWSYTSRTTFFLEVNSPEVQRGDDDCRHSSSECMITVPPLSGPSRRRRGVLSTCRRGREVLLFQFKSPDMLRPSSPSFTLLIARWRGGGGGGWSRLGNLHLHTHDSCNLVSGPHARIMINVKR